MKGVSEEEVPWMKGVSEEEVPWMKVVSEEVPSMLPSSTYTRGSLHSFTTVTAVEAQVEALTQVTKDATCEH